MILLIILVVLGVLILWKLTVSLLKAMLIGLGVTSFVGFGIIKLLALTIKTIWGIKQDEFYVTHIKFLFIGILFLLLGIIVTPLLFVSVVCILITLALMVKNWKRLNQEYVIKQQRKKEYLKSN